MKKNFPLITSTLLFLITSGIPFCVKAGIKHPLDSAQVGLIACLIFAGYLGSYLHYGVYLDIRKK